MTGFLDGNLAGHYIKYMKSQVGSIPHWEREPMGKKCAVGSSERLNLREVKLSVQPFECWYMPEGLYYV